LQVVGAPVSEFLGGDALLDAVLSDPAVAPPAEMSGGAGNLLSANVLIPAAPAPRTAPGGGEAVAPAAALPPAAPKESPVPTEGAALPEVPLAPEDATPLDPEKAGLAANFQPSNPEVLEQALASLVAQLNDLGSGVSDWVTRLSLSPWVCSLLAGAVLGEAGRRWRRAARRKALAAQQPAGGPDPGEVPDPYPA
jgi:hypothetical protein